MYQKYTPNIKSIYMAWYSMIQRCHDPKYRHYKHYGLKGVVVCDEWRNDYQKFLDWSLANGWEKGLELDKDINGNEDALFGKMHQLVRDEHYRLCVIFKRMFDYMDINKDYLRWVSENNGRVFALVLMAQILCYMM